jgi:hypothetical protein
VTARGIRVSLHCSKPQPPTAARKEHRETSSPSPMRSPGRHCCCR